MKKVSASKFAILVLAFLAAMAMVSSAQTFAPPASFNTLFTFNGSNGAYQYPYWNLVQGADGKFYGSTFSDTTNSGTIFAVTPTGALTTTLQDLPSLPYLSGLAAGGSFYGITGESIFEMTPAGTLTFLAETVSNPDAGVIQGIDGNFYGTAYGAVYRATPQGQTTTLASSPSLYSSLG